VDEHVLSSCADIYAKFHYTIFDFDLVSHHETERQWVSMADRNLNCDSRIRELILNTLGVLKTAKNVE
jgi:hypothetical protein